MVIYTKEEQRFRGFEEFASLSSGVHRLHPAALLVVIVGYITTISSYPYTAVSVLVPYCIFPVLLARLARIPLKPLITATVKVMPLIIMIGILQPFTDRHFIKVGSLSFSRGWIIFISLLIKAFLTILANFLLISILGIGGLQKAMKSLGLPPLFYLLFTMVYRYIMLLLEDIYRVMRAYEIRSGGNPKLQPQEWGTVPASILIRTYEQGLRIEQAMKLRGYDPAQPFGQVPRISFKDLAFILICISSFVMFRIFPISVLLGDMLITGFKALHG